MYVTLRLLNLSYNFLSYNLFQDATPAINDPLPVATNTPMGIRNHHTLRRGITMQQLYCRASNLGREIGTAMQELSLPAFEGWMNLFSELLDKIRANEAPLLMAQSKL